MLCDKTKKYVILKTEFILRRCKMNLREKLSDGLSKVKTYWKVPPLGNYMNYREILSLAGGGIGFKAIITCVEGMILSVGNNLIGNVIGIKPSALYVIYILGVLASFPLTALRANIIDNTRNKKGKYRPYLMSMGIPTAILGIGFVWMPYEKMSEFWACVVVLLFNIGFQFFYMFFYEVYNNYVVVLSPNSQERANVSSIKAVTDSLAPSIVNVIVPLFGRMITGTDTLNDIRIYRYVYPPIIIVGMLIGIIAYVNVEEKIVQAKTHVIQIRFIDAFRAVAKNKYFWIISLAGWLGFLESAYGNILWWLYNYQKACGAGGYALITTIYGNASFWGMILAPFMIKRFGKRNVLVTTNLFNILFIATMYPVIRYVNPAAVIWVVLICLFANGVVGAFAHILTPALNGDIRDYQQYVTGERIDGMFSAVGLIGTVITLLTSSVLPTLYERGGINEETAASMLTPSKVSELLKAGAITAEKADELLAGKFNAYDVLYDLNTFHHIIGILIVASVIGAAMNVIPYFFYDLSEVKQKAMIKVLKIRAMFEDFGNGALRDDALVESVDIIEEAKSLENASPLDLKEVKKGIGAAKRAKYSSNADKKAAVKAAKKAWYDARDYNENIEISAIVNKEMDKFSTELVKEKVRVAEGIYAGGLAGLVNVNDDIVKQAKALPKATEEEKLYRKAMIESAVGRLNSKKVINKNFGGTLTEFDTSVFDDFDRREQELDERQKKLYDELDIAKKAKSADKVKEIKDALKASSKERRELNANLKKVTKEHSLYYSAAKTYLNAKRLLDEKENYSHFEKIAAMYDDAKVRAAEERRLEEERRIQLEKEEKAFAEKLRAEKKAKK